MLRAFEYSKDATYSTGINYSHSVFSQPPWLHSLINNGNVWVLTSEQVKNLQSISLVQKDIKSRISCDNRVFYYDLFILTNQMDTKKIKMELYDNIYINTEALTYIYIYSNAELRTLQ